MTTIWSEHIDARFQDVPSNPLEKDYYPPYNKLLNYLFPPDGPFTVSPQSYPIRDALSVDFYIEYHILRENVVVFILEVKNGPRFTSLGARQEADDQIRRCLLELTDHCPLPKLRAASAFGTQLCFYEAEAVQGGIAIRPPRIRSDDPDISLDTAPRERWNCDVMEATGAQRLRTVVDEIVGDCTTIASLPG